MRSAEFRSLNLRLAPDLGGQGSIGQYFLRPFCEESIGRQAMQISHTSELANGRGHYAIGRIRAAAEWRAASASGARADRLTAMRELIREAEEYGADAIVGLEFHVDDVKRAEIEGASLLRIAVTGIAVKFIAAG
jgi:uncharacterized protein YbjQ (UPF0145 family)